MSILRKSRMLIASALVGLALFAFMPSDAQAAGYTVNPGDTLYKIGLLFNTTAGAIMKDNGLASTVIYPGQVLNVPSNEYTVKSGDTLYLIAKRHNISLSSIRKANNKWDDLIYPGQKLIIPGGSSSAGTQSNVSRGEDTRSSVIPYTQSELDLLARLIRSEAEGQPYSAQVAVGAVVVNRVKNPRFPNTIKDVIYQIDGGYYQFTPVQNGWINRPATAESKKAALEALKGSDPSNGALYYFDDSATNKWLWSKPLKARIGNMVYVY
jgi:N-acetylmuramoyl-L-alanine amidase